LFYNCARCDIITSDWNCGLVGTRLVTGVQGYTTMFTSMAVPSTANQPVVGLLGILQVHLAQLHTTDGTAG
jgi:hypothetical protein